MNQSEIIIKLYKAYGTDSGILFGITEKPIVEAIVNFTIETLSENKEVEPVKDSVVYNFSIKKGIFGTSLFNDEDFVCLIIEEQLPLFEALVEGYNYKLKNAKL